MIFSSVRLQNENVSSEFFLLFTTGKNVVLRYLCAMASGANNNEFTEIILDVETIDDPIFLSTLRALTRCNVILKSFITSISFASTGSLEQAIISRLTSTESSLEQVIISRLTSTESSLEQMIISRLTSTESSLEQMIISRLKNGVVSDLEQTIYGLSVLGTTDSMEELGKLFSIISTISTE